MDDADHFDDTSSRLARRALLVTLSLAFAGAALGLLAARTGMVVGVEIALVICSMCFSGGALGTLFLFPTVALQAVAAVSTSFFAANLCAGMLIAVYGGGDVTNFFVYLIWFFPLLVFNKLVNQLAVGRRLAKILMVAPLILIACLSLRLIALLKPAQEVLLGVYCLSYLCYALTLDIVARYREKYIVELEQAESLKVAAEVLESISDCFLSLDAGFRLVYLNDAACLEFEVERRTALNDTLAHAIPRFSSGSIQAGLRDSAAQNAATLFEAQSEDGGAWYSLRCFPRPEGMSIYFRNVTESVLARPKLEKAQARIHHLAFHDVLTGLPNRQLLWDRLTQALTAEAKSRTIGALLYIDLDDFKTVNDVMGHDTGDALLQQVAIRLTSCVHPTDTVARVGGDEFVVMLEGLGEDREAASAAATMSGDKILETFLPSFTVGTHQIKSTASIGITLFSRVSDSADDLMKRTGLAMYRAKSQGRNAMRFFHPSMQIEVETRAAFRSDLRRALRNDEFELHYQPQINSDGTVPSSEALLRWQHPLRGRVPPGEFIPLAEEAGLIVELGRWVLETACHQLALWAANPEMKHLTVSVNVSIRQFLDSHFKELVQETLSRTGANPLRLQLEITESSVMERVDDTIATMTEIRAWGVRFSLDDFGTGYSSLSHLRRLPLDQLKIDRSFINNVSSDATDASIARTIIGLGRSLKLSVIAEGVETEPQRDFLLREGCSLYQGFLYSPAVSVPEFEAFVEFSRREKLELTPGE